MSEEKKLFNPFWTRESITGLFDVQGQISVPSQNPYNTVYKKSDYVPLYSIMSSNLNIRRILRNLDTDNSMHFLKDVPKVVRRYAGSEMLKLVEQLLKEEEYRYLIPILNGDWFANSNRSSIKNSLHYLNTSYLRSDPNLELRISYAGLLTSIDKLFQMMKYCPEWSCNTIRSAAGPSKTYIVNHHFIGEVIDLTGRTPSNSGDVTVKPLVVMMVKRENINLIKHHSINCKGFDPSLVELWVDESLDSPTSGYNIRSRYISDIKKPYEALNIEMKTFASLDEELFNRDLPPKFKTIKDKSLWGDLMVSNFMTYERKRWGMHP